MSGKKKSSYKTIIALTVLAIAFAGIIYVMNANKNPIRTEVIMYGTSENKYNTDGYLVRNEKVYTSPADGMLNFYVQEGERVKKGQRVAAVFTGNVDEITQNKLSSINERLANLENSTIAKDLTVGDPVMADNAIKNRVSEIVLAAYNNNTAKVKQHKDDISILLSGKASLGDGSQSETSLAIEKLRQEKTAIEQSISSSHFDIYVDESGVFSSVIDGMEDYFSIDSVRSITPAMINQADTFTVKEKSRVTAGERCVKISDNYTWYFAANVDEKWVAELKNGERISVRFPDVSDRLIEGSVTNVSQPENGEVALVIACSEYVSDIYSTRRINADIVRQTYSGFKLPKSAVRVRENGETGVYIAKDHVARFRNVDISYSGEDYVIVKEDNSKENTLLLYDEVVVSGDDVTEGKIIKK